MAEPDTDGATRVSDADRQAVVDRLSAATGDGLLSLDEFADHAGRAYAAITRAQLDEVTRELHLPVLAPSHAPAHDTGPASAPEVAAKPRRRWIVAMMSHDERKGRWRVARRTAAVAFMGAVDLDLRDALLEGDEVEITAWAVMGGVTVIVPEGIAVELSGFMLMGGRSNRIKDVPVLPGAPVVRVRALGMWGGVDVRSKPRRPADAVPPHVPAAAVPPPDVDAPPGLLPQAGLVTIVCTDLVGSTRLADRLGDQHWRSLIGEHNAIVRAHLAEHGGHEVKTSGDGFLCTFPSARRAVAFAADVHDALARWSVTNPDTPIELRVGIHAGEVERDGDDIVGRNVALACRLCDAAAPGEVLVSSVVADLADSASDVGFGDPRTLELAGIDRPVVARPAGRR